MFHGLRRTGKFVETEVTPASNMPKKKKKKSELKTPIAHRSNHYPHPACTHRHAKNCWARENAIADVVFEMFPVEIRDQDGTDFLNRNRMTHKSPKKKSK
jgi:hypothetical protein